MAGTSAARGGAPPVAEGTTGGEGGRSSGRVAVVALILLVLVISYASSLRAWLQQRDDLAQAQVELVQTRERIDELGQTKLRWEDPAFVEQQARLRLGWLLPGEVGYRVIGADGEPLGATVSEPDSIADEPVQQDWYASVWGSIVAAGVDPEADAETEPVTPDPDKILRPTREPAKDRQ